MISFDRNEDVFPDLAYTSEVHFFDGSKLKSLPPHVLAGRVGVLAERLTEIAGQGEVVGIIHETAEDLLACWLACLATGLRPIILQFPTAKLELVSYAASIRHACAAAAIKALLLSDKAASALAETPLPVPHRVASGMTSDSAAPVSIIPHGTVIQMSSGTTGHRKPMALNTHDITRHIERFNEAIALTAEDTIISWLPLYHDMGFIACFCMPLVLGVPLVLMDPMTWVGKPGRLFDLIDEVGGTVCYMPNFGFEVLSRTNPRLTASMRLWVSCSEMVSVATVERFLAATDTPAERFACCYAMAENVFAVSIAPGFKALRYEDRLVASCGAPIPGTDVRVVDGELCVRSGQSIHAYIDGPPIVDGDGFYRTGDCGAIIDGEVAVFGRVHDVINQAGIKFFLSDIDLIANDTLADARGRLATVINDRGMGTEAPLLIVEAKDFFRRPSSAVPMDEIQKKAGIQNLDAVFVPPRFITKTSSGKVNRRTTAAHYQALAERRDAGSLRREGGVDELETALKALPEVLRIVEAVDSLGLIILRLLTEECGLTFNQEETVGALRNRLRQPDVASGTPKDPAVSQATFNIVSLCDARSFVWLNEKFLKDLEELVKAPVRLINLRLPPAGIVLSDLVFVDYMLPRVPESERRHYAAVLEQMNILRSASLVLVDDLNELYQISQQQTYQFIDHRFERDPRADLVGIRWQRYPVDHDALPVGIITGMGFLAGGADGINRTLLGLGEYLGVPVIRFASLPHFAPFTRDWEIILDNQIEPSDLSHENHVRVFSLAQQLKQQIARLAERCQLKATPSLTPLRAAEMPHFCSELISRSMLDEILNLFDSFVICGARASVPYISKRLSALGKPYDFAWHYRALRPEQKSRFACALVVGPMGNVPPEDIPYFYIMPNRSPVPYGNLPDSVLAAMSPHLRGARTFSEIPQAPSAGLYSLL